MSPRHCSPERVDRQAAAAPLELNARHSASGAGSSVRSISGAESSRTTAAGSTNTPGSVLARAK
jgi:hypothetical protein